MEDKLMGRYDQENLAKLRNKFGVPPEGSLRSTLDAIARAHADELRDIEGLKIRCEAFDCFTKVVLAGWIMFNNREYAFAHYISSGETNYAPIFRGWIEKIKDSSSA